MQIKIEIDVKPEELRRFLGLPDVAGLQDDVVRFLREKVGAASESFDPAAVLQASLDMIRRNPTWKLLRGAMGRDRDEAEVEVEAAPVKKPRAARKTASKTPRKKAAAKKPRRAKPAANAEEAPTS
ncbi:MAG: hypothetical protein JWQ90_4834 [Hydrocarboniphaga sp.]|uniref:hypothetical protein n=1 Tax=Hydrocarboniphaga sp. TaxID=2033016 RepID=UPI0026157732|nr:hypothetical protein [Hydrocarboniphaga sp.]MDB5972384.1 hypothetical protein [Hydrocarboniphaga sp.]